MAALEWYLCRGVIEELYARSDGRQDRSVVQRGCMVPKDGTREYDAEPGIKSEINRDPNLWVRSRRL